MKVMKKKSLILSIVFGLLTTISFAQEDKYFTAAENTEDYTVLELAKMDDQFSTSFYQLTKLLKK